MCVLDHCHAGHDQGHGVTVASSLSIYSTYAASQKDTATTMFHCRNHAFFLVLLTFSTPYSFEAFSSKNISWSYHSRVKSPSSLVLFQHEPWQILGGLFCALALGEASFMDNIHACHSSPVYTILCHKRKSPQFGFLLWLTAVNLHGDFLQPLSS
ncbi:unnamed protein product, partial [Staurois parvus]